MKAFFRSILLFNRSRIGNTINKRRKFYEKESGGSIYGSSDGIRTCKLRKQRGKEDGWQGQKKASEESKKDDADETEVQVFIAASLNTVMTEIAEKYNKDNPDVKITFNADSSGTLLTQIEEGV